MVFDGLMYKGLLGGPLSSQQQPLLNNTSACSGITQNTAAAAAAAPTPSPWLEERSCWAQALHPTLDHSSAHDPSMSNQ